MPQIATGRYKNGYPPSAGIANAWVAQNNYLWGLAANTRDVCVGSKFSSNSGSAIIGYQGAFRYGGSTTLLCNITVFTNCHITIPNDGVTKFIDLAAGTYNSLDISGGGASYTVGKQYVLTASSTSTQIFWIAAQVANAVNWPTLATFNDGTTPTETDYAAITTAQSNLLNILQTPTGQGVRVSNNNVGFGSPGNYAVGGFFYRGQNTLTVTFNAIGASLTVYGDAGSTDVFALTPSFADITKTFTLTPGNYTVGNFYSWAVSESGPSGYVDCISLGGAKTLTNPPQNFASLTPYRGSTGSPNARLKPVGGNGATDNLTEIAVAARGTPAIGAALMGFQFLSPMTIGKVTIDPVTQVGFTIGPSFRRPHILQYLAWKPSMAGQGGTVTLAVAPAGVTDAQAAGYSFGLTDTQNGGWNVTELDSQPGLAYGQFYVVTNVSTCFEVAAP